MYFWLLLQIYRAAYDWFCAPASHIRVEFDLFVVLNIWIVFVWCNGIILRKLASFNQLSRHVDILFFVLFGYFGLTVMWYYNNSNVNFNSVH